MSAIFITATGTDIGKTFVAAGLIRHWRAAGRTVDALKPVVTGYDPANATASDPGLLLAALGRPVTPIEIERISPWRFAAPLSPDMAARRENRTIDFDALVEFTRSAIANAKGTLLIEGIGGVMVPLDDTHTVLDWVVALDAPTLLVVGSYLGTLSHSLTAAAALRNRGARVAGVIVSESAEQPAPAAETAMVLARFLKPTPVHVLPRHATRGATPLLPLLAPYLR